MDHLNRHTYRNLLQQSQATIDNALSRPHQDKLVQTEQSLQELQNIFSRFGLTPTDMQQQWRPGSPKTGDMNFDDNSDDEHNEVMNPRSSAKIQSMRALPRATSPVPPLEIPQLLPTPTTITTVTASSLPLSMAIKIEAKVPNKNIVKLKGKTAAEKEESFAAVQIESRFKTYNPSSWRHEIIMKKDKGIGKEVLTNSNDII
jgi:hypothetical protein